MTELKTLKDFESHSWAGHKCIIEKELKAEAVKQYNSLNPYSPEDQYIREWIEYFFNLTEEDLQEEKEE